MNTSSFPPMFAIGKCQQCAVAADFPTAKIPSFLPYIRTVIPHGKYIGISYINQQICKTYSAKDFVK
jgi:hypothetical protein